jgi:hypothetical protein
LTFLRRKPLLMPFLLAPLPVALILVSSFILSHNLSRGAWAFSS